MAVANNFIKSGSGFPNPQRFNSILRIVTNTYMILLFIFGLWTLALIDKYYRLTRKAADQARQNWAK